MFDSSISLGNILTIGMFVVAVTVYVVSNANASRVLDIRLQLIDAQLEDFKNEMKKLSEVIIAQALQASRIEGISQTLISTGRRLDALEARFNSLYDKVSR